MKDKKLKNKFDLKKKINQISSNVERLELCKNIQTSINNLSQNELNEIFKILYNNNSTYTKNNNGIFVNLNWLNDDILLQLHNYTIFCIKSHKEIKKYEIIKNMYNETINKNKNKTEKNDDILLDNNNIDETIHVNKISKISSSMKFYLFKKKFLKKNINNALSNNNIYNLLTHEEYLINKLKNDL